MVGIQDSDFIIAVNVNNDSDAEIFNIWDLGMLGEHKEILPFLIKETKEKLK